MGGLDKGKGRRVSLGTLSDRVAVDGRHGDSRRTFGFGFDGRHGDSRRTFRLIFNGRVMPKFHGDGGQVEHRGAHVVPLFRDSRLRKWAIGVAWNRCEGVDILAFCRLLGGAARRAFPRGRTGLSVQRAQKVRQRLVMGRFPRIWRIVMWDKIRVVKIDIDVQADVRIGPQWRTR